MKPFTTLSADNWFKGGGEPLELGDLIQLASTTLNQNFSFFQPKISKLLLTSFLCKTDETVEAKFFQSTTASYCQYG